MSSDQPYRNNRYGGQNSHKPRENGQGERPAYRSTAPGEKAFSPNPNFPMPLDAARTPANSLLPLEAQLSQATQLAQRQERRWQSAPSRPAEAFNPAPAPQASPAPAFAGLPQDEEEEESLQPELGERRAQAPAPPAAPAPAQPEAQDPPPPQAAPATKPLPAWADEEDEGDNIGNRLMGGVPQATRPGGRRLQTRAMQSEHLARQQADPRAAQGGQSGRSSQSRSQAPRSGQRRSGWESGGDASATHILRQASQQRPLVQGSASELRPRRQPRPGGPRRNDRDDFGRAW